MYRFLEKQFLLSLFGLCGTIIRCFRCFANTCLELVNLLLMFWITASNWEFDTCFLLSGMVYKICNHQHIFDRMCYIVQTSNSFIFNFSPNRRSILDDMSNPFYVKYKYVLFYLKYVEIRQVPSLLEAVLRFQI